ncbi:hypothetical protein [Anaerobranca gottschalkii]|uniref:Uncharacterized protein n=1 Tax=Anaerobranca gottschalkii DSM 13577 TaxID=1120990 RepID=A0A1H9ZER9_9FIRM|nr:hypothetical protein [Anaerobranca gottschalkii]SES80017.1 hypothetical protein SAMN03080614_100867 [Anaerobranca gottschalkii DSM 13577]
MVDDIYLGLKEVLDKVNKYEEDYYQLKSRLIEAETKLALKKTELINSKKITGRNDMFREAQLIQFNFYI